MSPKKRSRVAVVGSANMDLVFTCERIPRPGETLLGTGFRLTPGGKGANQAAAIGALGGEPLFVAKVGRDGNGERLLASLTARGVDVSGVLFSENAPTGVAGITVNAAAENSIVVVAGANSLLTQHEVRSLLSSCHCKVVLTQLEIPLEAVAACVSNGMMILNPAPYRTLTSELLRRVDVIVPNQSETEALTGVYPSDERSCTRAARSLLDQGVGTVVLTLGDSGCFIADQERYELIQACAVQPVDTTGAGDAFCGALAHFLAEDQDIWNAAALANCVAALSTTKPGAQDSMPTMEQLGEIAAQLLVT